MKKSIRLFCVVALMASGFASYSQKTQPVTDSVKSNTELNRLHSDIASLIKQLSVANTNLSEYKSALNKQGAVRDLRQPHESASLRENNNLNTLYDKVFLLSDELGKKQQRVQDISANAIL